MNLVDYAYHLILLTPILLLWLAEVVRRAPHQELSNRMLAAFCAVVACGFMAQFAWKALTGIAPAVIPGLQRTEHALGMIDPLLLLAFALACPHERVHLRSPAVWAPLAVTAIAIFLLVDSMTGTARAWSVLLHVAYVNGVYFAAFLILLRTYRSEPGRLMARQMGFVTVGVGFAALSRSAAPFLIDGLPILQPVHPALAAVLGFALAMVLLTATTPPRQRLRSGKQAILVLAMVTAFFFAGWGVLLLLPVGAFWGYASFYYAYRWIVFAGIVGYGALRFQLFDFQMQKKAAASHLVAFLIAVALAMATGVLASDAGAPLAGTRALALLAGVGAGMVAVPVLRRVSGVQDGPVGDRFQRLTVYEATLETALRKPKWTPAEQRFVATLRDVFEVTAEEHAEVMRRVRAATMPAGTTDQPLA